MFSGPINKGSRLATDPLTEDWTSIRN